MTPVEGRGASRSVIRSAAAAVGAAGLLVCWTGAAQAPESVEDRSTRTALRSPPSSPAAPARPRAAAKPTPGGVPDRIASLVLPEARPTAVAIPRLGVRSTLESLGVDASGAMDVPADPARAGWYSPGPSPGALGPAVIAGHVTWDRLPAVFWRLETLKPGDVISVSRADGREAVFAVERVAQFAKARFPTKAVFGAINHAGLRLITCGGTYDASDHRYLDNVVVFAVLTDVR